MKKYNFGRQLLIDAALGLVVFLIQGVSPQLIKAQTINFDQAPAIAIKPAFQEIILTTDQDQTQAEITIANYNPQPLEFEFFLTEFTHQDHFGSIAFISQAESSDYLANPNAFISLNQDRTVIPAHSQQTVTIYVRDMPSFSPGGHYLALVARVVDVNQELPQILPAVSSLLLIRKEGGELINLSLKSLDWSPRLIQFKLPSHLKLLFSNSGNIHLVPRGKLTITDMFGRVVAQGSLNESSLFILPGTERYIPVKVQASRRLWPISLLFLEVRGSSQQTDTPFAFETSFLYLDYRWLIILLLLGSLGVLIWRHQSIKSTKSTKPAKST